MKEDLRSSGGVEIMLDNRQVFLLFFASAVILSLVFTLGVVVGKRAERQAAPVPVTDPLALLDQLGGQDKSDETLTFHEALSGAKNGSAPEEQKAAEKGASETNASTGDPSPTKLTPSAAPEPAPQAPAAAPKPAAAPAKPAPASAPPKAPPAKLAAAPKPAPVKPAAIPPFPGLPEGLLARFTRSAAEKRAAEKPAPVAEKRAGAEKPRAKGQGESATAAKDPSPAAGEGAETYSLQLSSFQDKREAELFMQKLREGGLKPYVIPTTIPGRGVWFRVRVGRYKTWDEALSAKQGFERSQKIIAYVAKN